MDTLSNILATIKDHQWSLTLAQIAGLLLVVWLANLITRSVLLRLIRHTVMRSAWHWDDTLVEHSVTARLAGVVPALIVYTGIGLVSGLPGAVVTIVRSLASAYIVLVIVLAIGNLLTSIGAMYERRNPDRARAHPIKSYLQLIKIIAYLIAAVLIVAAFLNKNPLLFLSGIGALSAVLMLVFKDTILSLVAGIQLAGDDMVRVGDWIEMPQNHADGDVIDISLHTVKVRNWNRTVTTIPTWRLINESFINWRDMYADGRHIKRAIYLDQTSVRFLTEEDCNRLRSLTLLNSYLANKQSEIKDYNKELIAQDKGPINSRQLTNVGTFRAYVQAYVESHPGIHHGMFQLVRQLQPGATGLPLQIYCYTALTGWADYENIQADIFDHLYAILPEFGLRVFQEPSGADVHLALKAATAQ